ncbi:MAG: hypothetical protein KJZ85_16850 [Rhodobacteraceae bacterium]|jgi:hypothetical protein|nr:hypothetical protein [Paracoccaceae bacterium]
MPNPNAPVLAAVLCTYRTLLGALLLVVALGNTLVPLGLRAVGRTIPVGELTAIDASLKLAACALLATVGLWLLFGIRTRVVASLGAALAVGLAVAAPESMLAGADPLRGALGALVLASPLVVFGGGRWSAYRKGWRGVL